MSVGTAVTVAATIWKLVLRFGPAVVEAMIQSGIIKLPPGLTLPGFPAKTSDFSPELIHQLSSIEPAEMPKSITPVIAHAGMKELAGSHRDPLPTARRAHAVNPSEHCEVTVRLRADGGNADLDIAKVKAFAQSHGLAVTEVSAARKAVKLAGTASKVAAAFGSELHHCHTADGITYRGRTGSIYVPDSLAGVITAVLGLDNRPAAKSRRRYAAHAQGLKSFTPPQVAALYGVPTGASAAGKTIGVLELGGGFKMSVLANYMNKLGLPTPQIEVVLVDHAKNAPDGANGADGELYLDLDVLAAVALGAKLVVYLAPNTDQGFSDGISVALHDTTNNIDALSISWGGPESDGTPQYYATMNSDLEEAGALGITITVASGDNGSSDGAPGVNVDFPASSPWVLACGGTRLIAAGPTVIASETVWNDGAQGGAGGGGISEINPVPSYQGALTLPFSPNGLLGRSVPDIAMNADPDTGYIVRANGVNMVIGGTSAVAPLAAALIVLANAKTGKRAGFINPLLYANPGICRDITQGTNGRYAAHAGFDQCTGWGSLNYEKLVAALAAS